MYRGGREYPSSRAVMKAAPSDGDELSVRDIRTVTDEEKIRFVREYFLGKSIKKIANENRLRVINVRDMASTAWWQTELRNLEMEAAVQVKVKLTVLADMALDELEDRLVNGDEKAVGKDGIIERVKVPARDLAAITNMLFDKKAQLEDRSSGFSTTETKRLLDLAAALRAKEVSPADVADAEVIEGESHVAEGD